MQTLNNYPLVPLFAEIVSITMSHPLVSEGPLDTKQGPFRSQRFSSHGEVCSRWPGVGLGEMNQWLLTASSQQGRLPGGSPAEEGGHVHAVWKMLGSVCSDRSQTTVLWVIKSWLQRPAAGHSILGLTSDS